MIFSARYCGAAAASPSLSAQITALFSGGEEGVWYDPSDLSTLWQDAGGTSPVTADGQTVKRIDDKSGNGNHATSATGATYKTGGGLHWLAFDGVGDFLGPALFTIVQPWQRVSAIEQVGFTSGTRIFAGGIATTGLLSQSGASPNLTMRSGANVSTNPDPAIGAAAVIAELHNGASSSVQTGNSTAVTGDAGTILPGGITLGALHTGLTGFCSHKLFGVVMRKGSDADLPMLKRWAADKAGVSI